MLHVCDSIGIGLKRLANTWNEKTVHQMFWTYNQNVFYVISHGPQFPDIISDISFSSKDGHVKKKRKEVSSVLKSENPGGSGNALGNPSESKFLHQQINPGVHLKSMQVIGVSLKPHQQASVRHVRRSVHTHTLMQLMHSHWEISH